MRFLLFFGLVLALLIAVYLGALYGFVSYSTVEAELLAATAQIRPTTLPHTLPALAHTAARYAYLRSTIAIVLGGAILGLAAVGVRGGRQEIRRLAQDIARAFWAVTKRWQRLARAEQGTAGLLLLLVVGMRYWFLRHNSFDPDEMVSLDHFARHAPRIAASFYQLPNNHVLYNTLTSSLLRLAPAHTNPELLVRLPTFILGIVGTGLLYAVLVCLVSFRGATLLWCSLQLVPISIEYTVVARGYGLQAACVYALFMAVLVLLRGPRYHRLAWAVALLSSLLGLYLIPTFIYPFLSLGAGLVGGTWLQGRGRIRAAQALVAGAAVALLTGLLYLPIGLLSGWHTLLANPYVAQMSNQEFWTLLGPYYLWGLTGSLFGYQAVTIPLLLLLMSGGLLLVRRWAPARHWAVAALAWVGVLAPLLLLVAQRMFPPPRTLHYLVFFVLLLAVLLFEAVVRRTRLPPSAAWLVAGSCLAGYAGFRIPRQVQALELNRTMRAHADRAHYWLQRQHTHRIFTDTQDYHIYLQHMALAWGHPPLPLQLAGDGPISGTYDYLLLKRGSPLPGWASQQSYKVAYQHADVVIYRLTTAWPGPTQPTPTGGTSTKLRTTH